MKKVLFLINTLGNGGAERVLVNLVNNMDRSRFDVTVKTLFDEGVNKQFINEDVKYESVFKKVFKGYNYVFGILPYRLFSRYIVKGDYDIIVVYLHGILTKIISRYDGNSKKIAWIHADMENSPFLDGFKDSNSIDMCFKNYNAIVGVSKNVSKSFVNRVGFNDKVYVKYNTFDIDLINKKSHEDIERNIISNDIINLCSVGKLDKVKGYDRLLRVLNRLNKEGIQFNLNIIGEGSERKSLQMYIDNKGLANSVRILGYKENPYKYIKNSDIFVCSSLSEGYSSVVVESLILGIPVITTDCTGMRDILGEDSEYGLIVNNDEESLYKGIKSLILDKKNLEHYKNKAKERKDFFNIKNTVKEVERLLEEV